MAITLTSSVDGVDWTQAKADLAADRCDNGRDGDRLVGMARMLSDGVCNAYVADVWTHSAHRRRGIATTLMRMLEDAAPGQHIGLQTDDAQKLYRRLDNDANR